MTHDYEYLCGHTQLKLKLTKYKLNDGESICEFALWKLKRAQYKLIDSESSKARKKKGLSVQ